MSGAMTGVRIAAYVIRSRVRLARRMRTESLSAILDDIDATATRAGRSPPRPPDRAMLLALRAGESIVSRARVAPNTCLFRALGRYALFRSHGHRAVFVLAIRSDTDGGEGHAWVELGGVPFGESIAPELVVTLRHPR
jgi:hypothetical protein